MRIISKRRLLLLVTTLACIYGMFRVSVLYTGFQNKHMLWLKDINRRLQSAVSYDSVWKESTNIGNVTLAPPVSVGVTRVLSRTMDNYSSNRKSGIQNGKLSVEIDFTQCQDQTGFVRPTADMNIAELKDVLPMQNNHVYVPGWQRRHRGYRNGHSNSNLLKNRVVSPRYYLTSVVRLRLYKEDKAKMTIAELKQWLHYQFWAGTQHVYICNHFLDETEKIDTQLEAYIKLGLVTVFPWNVIRAVPGSPNYSSANYRNQVGCYNFIRTTYGTETVWQYNMDMDEYPYCPNDRCEGFLTRYLQKLEMDAATQYISEIRLANFVLKGQGDRSRNIMIDRITRITPNGANDLVKPIYKMADVSSCAMHRMEMKRGRSVYPDPDGIKMLHYHGARDQNWGPDTEVMKRSTEDFNDVRYSIAVNVRNSLVAFNEVDAFSNKSGP